MNQRVTIRSLAAEELPLVARVHVESFPNSALTKLGMKVVEKYYLWQLTGPHEKVRAAGAFVGDECAGFSFSGVFEGSTSGFIHKNRTLLAGAVLSHPGLLLNSLFLKRLTEGVRLLFRFAKKRPPTDRVESAGVPNYGILSIAVSPRFQKLGVGRLLMMDAEEEAIRYGRREICLTVHPANEKAVRFYEKQHWQKLFIKDLWNGAMTKILK
jgi:ribosomal protein S18 acetylase RimI-like enzyme